MCSRHEFGLKEFFLVGVVVVVVVLNGPVWSEV